MTKILKINDVKADEDKITEAAEVIRGGGTVVFPTETVYGLGANALDENAVRKIFEAKGRPGDNPIIVHISNIDELEPLVEQIPDNALTVAKEFWPGPITIILKKSSIVPYITTGGLDTVAIRMPNNEIALELIRKSGVPIAAPSANISGKPSPTTSEHVIHDLNDRVDMIISGEDSHVGLESTVLDLSRGIPNILRPGKVTLEQLRELLGDVRMDKALEKKDDSIVAIAPGMKYTHYSPNADVIIIDGELEKVIQKISSLAGEYELKNKKVGIMATEQTKNLYKNGQVISLGSRENLSEIASNLFSTLRQFDKIGVDIILSESFESIGIGLAIMNRLTKAAGYNIIRA